MLLRSSCRCREWRRRGAGGRKAESGSISPDASAISSQVAITRFCRSAAGTVSSPSMKALDSKRRGGGLLRRSCRKRNVRSRSGTSCSARVGCSSGVSFEASLSMAETDGCCSSALMASFKPTGSATAPPKRRQSSAPACANWNAQCTPCSRIAFTARAALSCSPTLAAAACTTTSTGRMSLTAAMTGTRGGEASALPVWPEMKDLARCTFAASIDQRRVGPRKPCRPSEAVRRMVVGWRPRSGRSDRARSVSTKQQIANLHQLGR